MKIKIINVGNKLNKWESDGIGYYQKQLPKNIKISFINLKGQQNPNLSKKEILQKKENKFCLRSQDLILLFHGIQQESSLILMNSAILFLIAPSQKKKFFL